MYQLHNMNAIVFCTRQTYGVWKPNKESIDFCHLCFTRANCFPTVLTYQFTLFMQLLKKKKPKHNIKIKWKIRAKLLEVGDEKSLLMFQLPNAEITKQLRTTSNSIMTVQSSIPEPLSVNILLGLRVKLHLRARYTLIQMVTICIMIRSTRLICFSGACACWYKAWHSHGDCH
jgi:hypothetical protein